MSGATAPAFAWGGAGTCASTGAAKHAATNPASAQQRARLKNDRLKKKFIQSPCVIRDDLF
jgi:Ni,Fe-hydrogenase I small subunit